MTPHFVSPPSAALDVVRRLRDAGYQAWFAGGCVRDWLLGRTVRDIDIATSARPGAIEALFPAVRAIGRAFGVMQVSHQGETYEVATFRTDHGSADGRHPEAVSFASDVEDARRRDFTINGMFYDPERHAIIDYVGGQVDLKRRVVRTIGRPADRFGEDYLRMLRAVRFASVLEFEIAPPVVDALRACAPRITTISPERIARELTRILLESPRAGHALHLLRETGLLQPLLPEVASLTGQEQPPEFHPEGDVFTHTAMMLDAMEDPDPVLAYAVLFHDIAKPTTATFDTTAGGRERIRFPNHALEGAEMAAAILRRLRFSNQLVDDVAACVRHHMTFINVPRMKPSTLRRMMSRPTFPTELELHRLDCLCSHGRLETYRFLSERYRELPDAPNLPPRWVTGHDVLALGVSPGPEVGTWLDRAYRRQLDGEAVDREALLDWLRTQIAEGSTDREPPPDP